MIHGPDLTISRAKILRAQHLIAELDRELSESVHVTKPYSIASSFDSDSGWLMLSLNPEPVDPSLAVVVGEVIHDLRSALDYVVTALVEASGGTLTTRHQFPIFGERSQFGREVGTFNDPRGPLLGITLGFEEIESSQPFQLPPEVDTVPALLLLQRLSNSDKHRSVVAAAAFPQSHDLRLRHNGLVVDSWQPEVIVWNPAAPTEFQRVRFGRPYPTMVEPEADLKLELGFFDRPFPPRYPDGFHFGTNALRGIVVQVEAIVELIEGP